jgi:ComF family protein
MPDVTHPFSALASWLAPLIELVYPSRCAACAQPGAWFCPACQAAVEPAPLACCAACGRPAAEVKGLCRQCLAPGDPLNGILATALFAGPIRPVIHRFKYNGIRALARPLSARLADTWLASGLSADLVVPVPLHRRREAERGYNQATLLAQALGRQLNLPVNSGLLVRQRATESQTAMNYQQRQENVRGAFACCGPAAGLRVLVVDDVSTTGATMEACAAALGEAGALEVWGLAVARAKFDPRPARRAA